MGKLLKLIMAMIMELIRSAITSVIYNLETAFYSGLIAYTPISEFTMDIALSWAILVIAVGPHHSRSIQPCALTITKAIVYAPFINWIAQLNY